MKNNLKIIVIINIILLSTLTFSSNILSTGWQKEYLGSNPLTRFYPDLNANYWSYHLKRTKEYKDIGLIIRGTLAQLRYFSVNLYNDKDYSSIESLSDQKIISTNSEYTLYVLPDHIPFKYSHKPNVLFYKNSLEKISIFLRYYLPKINFSGGQPLPKITAFDLNTMKSVPLPSEASKRWGFNFSFRDTVRTWLIDRFINYKISPFMKLNKDRKIYSYRLDASNLYPNQDNHYLCIPFTLNPHQSAIIRFIAPHTTGLKPSVRYWSISLGDEKTYTHWTVHDQEVELNDRRYVYLIISHQAYLNVRVPEKYSYKVWGNIKKGILIYRNLLTRESYPFSIKSIPIYDKSNEKSAYYFIGDYAPHGVLVNNTTLLETVSLSDLFE